MSMDCWILVKSQELKINNLNWYQNNHQNPLNPADPEFEIIFWDQNLKQHVSALMGFRHKI